MKYRMKPIIAICTNVVITKLNIYNSCINLKSLSKRAFVLSKKVITKK